MRSTNKIIAKIEHPRRKNANDVALFMVFLFRLAKASEAMIQYSRNIEYNLFVCVNNIPNFVNPIPFTPKENTAVRKPES
jgi:hypothetical protein